MLELINRARLNPQAEAERLGINLNDNLAAGSISSETKQVLAASTLLNTAALAHSQHMFDVDQFAHSGIGDATPGDRITVSGYQWNSYGENIAWTSGVDIQDHHDNLFWSAGHRENILETTFKEVGIGSVEGTFDYNGNSYASSLMTTQNFGTSGTPVFITGVAYNDTWVDDDFYSIGEGRSGVKVSVFSDGTLVRSSSTGTSGGYAVRIGNSGQVEVVFSGGSVTGKKGALIDLGLSNVKIDIVDGVTIETNASITFTRSTNSAKLLGQDDASVTGNSLGNKIVGNNGSNKLMGGAGADIIKGGAGVDSLSGGKGADKIQGDGGADFINGGAGSDRFTYLTAKDGGDTIHNFDKSDSFVFEGSAFGFGDSTGYVGKSSFKSGSTNVATTEYQRFVYNTTDDTLWYDSNGSADGGTHVMIADLNNDTNVFFYDIVLI